MMRIGLIVLALASGTAAGWWLVSSVWSQPGDRTPPAPGERFAGDRIPDPVVTIPFDAARSMKYLRQLCDIGPRVSGSEGMKRQREMIVKHFEGLGAEVTLQEFDARQPSRPRPIRMANVIISWHPESERRVIVCGHYDTRPLADQEPLRRDWEKPFVSANDGTSTVALLMELGHHMKELPTTVGVDFVLFDGEEYVFRDRFHGDVGEPDRYFIGSEEFADRYKNDPPGHVYVAAVLLDLFAGKGATYPVEQNSAFFARPLVDMVWGIARERGANSFRYVPGPEVRDDHLALNRVGIPAIDIIDFSYRHWHRLSDTPEQCSPEKMAEVADVVAVWLQRMK